MVKKIDAYMTTDGSVFQDIEKATRYEAEISVKNAMMNFLNTNMTSCDVQSLNQEQLDIIFNNMGALVRIYSEIERQVESAVAGVKVESEEEDGT